MNQAQTLAKIKAGAVQVLPESDLIKKISSGKKLKIKLGMDPTSPDLHLGHAVVLSKLRDFQDLGHEVIFLIDDFTARIGDPTGRSKTRPPLTTEDIAQNMQSYFEQVGKVLDPQRATIAYNSTWLQNLSIADLLELCAKVTLARLIEREDFAKRLSTNQPISFHELLYPIFQGYDSVALHADVELGGTDQTFNLLMGRFLQEQYKQEPQVILTMPLLEGLDGHNKMSKSLGNAVGLADAPDQAFGKLMSISDDMMWKYAQLLLNVNDDELNVLKNRVASGELHPMNYKKSVAHGIITRFWSKEEADDAQKTFEALFQKKDYSQANEVSLPSDMANPVWIADLLKTLGAVTTSSEVKRLIDAKAIHIDNNVIADFKAQVQWYAGMIIKVGKTRIYRIV
jgi:tyrosyl-tRNA synthetase